jgi:hypothetical protein
MNEEAREETDARRRLANRSEPQRERNNASARVARMPQVLKELGANVDNLA